MLSFDQIQKGIYDFRDAANVTLTKEQRMFYSSNFVTGQIARPNFLFLGINPGFGRNEWPDRDIGSRRSVVAQPIKFLAEYEEGASLARKIVEVLFDGDVSGLNNCAESSVRSFFATPDVKVLDQQLTALPRDPLFIGHERLMEDALRHSDV